MGCSLWLIAIGIGVLAVTGVDVASFGTKIANGNGAGCKDPGISRYTDYTSVDFVITDSFNGANFMCPPRECPHIAFRTVMRQKVAVYMTHMNYHYARNHILRGL